MNDYEFMFFVSAIESFHGFSQGLHSNSGETIKDSEDLLVHATNFQNTHGCITSNNDGWTSYGRK